jgi:hypothetical protein
LVTIDVDPWCGMDGTVRGTFDFKTASLDMPASSLFAGTTIQEAQKYFVERYADFNAQPNHWTAVRIDRTEWNVVSIDKHAEDVYQFMQDSAVFPKGECEYDSTFYVSDLDYHWHVLAKYKM